MRSSTELTSLDRRDFLRRALFGVSIAGTYPIFLGKTAALAAAPGEARGEDDGRVLVVLQLSGGNDGLSTVVPYADPAYGQARTAIRIGEKDVLRIDGYHGLHPGLKEVKELYDEGAVAIVQGASYPNPTRSHFEAMDIWQAGNREEARHGTGWLGRAVDCRCANPPLPAAVSIGPSVALALTGRESRPLAFAGPEGYQWRGTSKESAAFEAVNSAPGGEPAKSIAPLDYLRRVAADARDSSTMIRKAAQGFRPQVEFPSGNRLGADLRTVAALIASRFPTRIYYVSIGGFDTHSSQRGTHDNLMKTLSTALGAFLRELKAQGSLQKVMVLTFSEFGRRVKENASRGTDHGVAAPLFLLGGGVKGGLHGRHPSLTQLVGGDLAMSVDFRRVYAEVLDGWLAVPSEKVLGERFAPLGLLGGNGKQPPRRV